jgi:hypothetical protein
VGESERTSVVKMQHLSTYFAAITPGIPPAMLFAYQLTYIDALALFCKMAVSYPGCRIVEEVCMKYK